MSTHSMFFPELLGAEVIQLVSNVWAPCFQHAVGPGNFPCLKTRDSSGGANKGYSAVFNAWVKLPIPDHALYTGGLMPKLVVISQGNGDATTSALTRPEYRIEIVRPYTFTPTTSPNGSSGSRTLTPVDYTCSSVATDTHASDGSDWSSVLATEVTLTAPSGGSLASTLNRGQALLHVFLPALASANDMEFLLLGLGWQG